MNDLFSRPSDEFCPGAAGNSPFGFMQGENKKDPDHRVDGGSYHMVIKNRLLIISYRDGNV